MVWPAGFHQCLETFILDYTEWPHTFSNPFYDLDTVVFTISHQPSIHVKKWDFYRVSDSVWARCEYVIFPLPVLSNTAVIDPSRSSAPLSACLADSMVFASSELSTISRPQQFMACTRSALVEALSFVSRNRRTRRGFFPLPLQFFASQVNS
jgi:hypothetical protein